MDEDGSNVTNLTNQPAEDWGGRMDSRVWGRISARRRVDADGGGWSG